MKKVTLTCDQVVRVHDHIAGRSNPLSAALADLKAGDGIVVPVEPQTVFHLEGLFRLARDNGLIAEMQSSQGLDPRETEFINDFNHFFLKKSPPSEPNPSSVLSDLFALLRHGTGALLSHDKSTPVPDSFASATLIGAYGGEHVGDAAILGGVLLGLNQDFGTTRATIMSKRPQHTLRLAAKLETPVEVTVEPYGHREISHAVAQNDALVFAGGPLMDLPRMLVMHLKSARLAAAMNTPFLVRNVGVGPFKRKTSRWIAHQIAGHASVFSVRTKKAAQDSVLAGLDINIGHDPAFDYLASRKELTLLTEKEKSAVDGIMDTTKKPRLIGLNIRPIRHDWAVKGADFSQNAETQFFNECAKAMIAIGKQSDRPVVFVFFPMNPIQLGGSDLESAYRLQKLLQGRADMQVLEADPDVDGMLYLLRQLDSAITMRFHASIFCLSQGLGTVGIDYYPGQGGKVEQLFSDLGKEDLVRRMDQVDADWMHQSVLDVQSKDRVETHV
ncbi:MAG: polysaccharide pyruvyl transferase family protein [Paracoccaceae bacterium]